jgi:hypothetical protein
LRLLNPSTVWADEVGNSTTRLLPVSVTKTVLPFVATSVGLLRPVKDSTTADPAAVEDCWGCADVADGAADAVAVAVAVAPDAGVAEPDAGAVADDAAEATADIAEAAAVPGVAAEPGPDAPVLEHAAFPTVATTIATVPAILVN